MSKKTKRLEKENYTIKRKHEATNANIITMAEERETLKSKTAKVTKKAEMLISIIEQMQQQGRKVPPEAAATVESLYADYNGDMDGDGSDYSDEAEGVDEEDHDHSEEFDDDTEEEAQPSDQAAPPPRQPYGPERPPVPAPQPATNGH